MSEMKIKREEPMKMLIDKIPLPKRSKGKLELKYCSTNEQVADI